MRIWHNIPNMYPYQVNLRQQVRNRVTKHVYSVRVNKHLGYKEVTLTRPGTSNPTRYYLHHLMAFAFLGRRPRGYHIDHINGRRDDCRLKNLRYLPHKENRAQGWKGKSRKLKKEDIREIYRRAWRGENQTLIGKKYGITQTMVSYIKLGKELSTITGHL